jgi:hypothetical protein
MKRDKKVKDLRVRGASNRQAGAVKGGTPQVFEIKDFSFGVENPTTIGSGTGGTGAGKVSSFGELNPKKP